MSAIESGLKATLYLCTELGAARSAPNSVHKYNFPCTSLHVYKNVHYKYSFSRGYPGTRARQRETVGTYPGSQFWWGLNSGIVVPG
eukprot:1709640-Rhodomonas_salina.1